MDTDAEMEAILANARFSKRKPNAELSGAIYIAIEDAERYGTSLVVMRDGRIEEVSPQDMRRRLKERGQDHR